MWMNFPGLCLILYIGCFIGVALYALYRNCDPIKFGTITATDQVWFPLCSHLLLDHSS